MSRFKEVLKGIMKRAFAVLAVLAVAAAASANASDPFKVIVNPKVAGKVISRDALAQIFLGKAKSWGDGRAIAAVDLSSTSSVREAFSSAVLGMPVAGVKAHWLRSLGQGARPPVTRQSDEDVIAFVAAEPGGVGYVSETAVVPPTVREVPVQ